MLFWDLNHRFCKRHSKDLHIAEFAKELQFDLGDKPLVLNGLWINILPEGGIHTI